MLCVGATYNDLAYHRLGKVVVTSSGCTHAGCRSHEVDASVGLFGPTAPATLDCLCENHFAEVCMECTFNPARLGLIEGAVVRRSRALQGCTSAAYQANF